MTQQLAHGSKVDWRIINWLRGLAAFYVVINHSRGFLFSDTSMYAKNVHPESSWAWWEWLQVGLMQFTNLGSEFVIFFFLLSGFSIAHSVKGTQSVKSFYKRRFIRLYPTYLVGIFWAFLIYFLIRYATPEVYYGHVEGHEPLGLYFDKLYLDIRTLVANLLYIPIDNYMTHQYWSLPYEVLFYIIAPWMITRLRIFGFVTVSCYAVGWLIFGYYYHNTYDAYKMTPFFTDFMIYFLVGILFYRYTDMFIRYFFLNKQMTIFTATLLFITLSLTKGYAFGQEHNKLTGVITMLLMYVLLFGSLKHKINIKWLEKIGLFSYTLYVTHLASIFIVKVIVYRMGLNFYMIDNMWIWYAGIVSSMGFAYLLYYMGEHQSTAYLNKLREQRSSKKSRPVITGMDIPPVPTMTFKSKRPANAKLDPLAGHEDSIK